MNIFYYLLKLLLTLYFYPLHSNKKDSTLIYSADVVGSEFKQITT